ncbi:hypothetical protein, partial [Pseudomonas sp. HY2-MNA-CIBAN-0224]|uniref:hypothetical protein n=1 Tax=Pseudomonas sp. HY2-MNA-CIBAN-0224 TaxID=3140471 RepID=UPI00332EC194
PIALVLIMAVRPSPIAINNQRDLVLRLKEKNDIGFGPYKQCLIATSHNISKHYVIFNDQVLCKNDE